jgi:agmatinase
MRRAAEMDHVERIVQVGLRGVGSARTSDVADARAAGNLLITARELRARGVGWLLEELPRDARLFVVFDLDGLDPSVAPAVSGVSPGGVSYDEAGELLAGVAERCRVVGAAFTELVPDLDVNGISALVVVRMVMRLVAGLDRHRVSNG